MHIINCWPWSSSFFDIPRYLLQKLYSTGGPRIVWKIFPKFCVWFYMRVENHAIARDCTNFTIKSNILEPKVNLHYSETTLSESTLFEDPRKNENLFLKLIKKVSKSQRLWKLVWILMPGFDQQRESFLISSVAIKTSTLFLLGRYKYPGDTCLHL